jgi:hypothetical protein
MDTKSNTQDLVSNVSSKEKVRWWGSKIDLTLSIDEIMEELDRFLGKIPGITDRKKVVWKVSFSDLLAERNEPHSTERKDEQGAYVSIVVKETTGRDLYNGQPKKSFSAFFVDGKIRLLFLDWLFTHNRFRGYKSPMNAFEMWKQQVWNDYALSVTAGNTREMMTLEVRDKLSDRYHKVNSLKRNAIFLTMD